jgi:hypothetical protein
MRTLLNSLSSLSSRACNPPAFRLTIIPLMAFSTSVESEAFNPQDANVAQW